MRTRVVLWAFALITITVPIQWAGAQANYRSAVDRQAKQAQACKDQQNRKFEAIERDADRLFKAVRDCNAPIQTSPVNARVKQRP